MTGLYVIPLFGLSEGRHVFDFKIGNRFFDDFEESEIKEGELDVETVIDRCRTYIDLTLTITGSVRVSCDRCLEMYSQPIDFKNHIIIRQGESLDDTDPDILTVPYDLKEFDLSHLLYEYIHLALPLRRIHPDDPEGKSGCNPEMLKELNKHLINKSESENTIWSELRKLLNNN